ncbi:MAG TPA: Yip1 family protein [Paucimonas sp.]|nr:Yip1 family protein [Paucimonas sp.]
MTHSPLHYMKMVTSFHDGWDDVSALHPAVLKTFLCLVLPMSLLPPAMLLYAGADHPLTYLMNAPYSRWKMVAAAFFVTELLTVPLMGWVIKSMAETHRIACDFKDSFLLAAITAVPLWVSSLGLAIDNMWIMIIALVAGLMTSASLLYHGTYTILRLEDDEEAHALSSSAFSVGGLVWAFLCAFVVLPLIA